MAPDEKEKEEQEKAEGEWEEKSMTTECLLCAGVGTALRARHVLTHKGQVLPILLPVPRVPEILIQSPRTRKPP